MTEQEMRVELANLEKKIADKLILMNNPPSVAMATVWAASIGFMMHKATRLRFALGVPIRGTTNSN